MLVIPQRITKYMLFTLLGTVPNIIVLSSISIGPPQNILICSLLYFFLHANAGYTHLNFPTNSRNVSCRGSKPFFFFGRQNLQNNKVNNIT
jgi:hypothetical protein